MATTFVQFRVEESAKKEAASICKELGIDLPTYMRMCIARLNSCKGIPFDMRLNSSGESKQATANPGQPSEEEMRLERIKAQIASIQNK